ncbi:DUF6265 family protein, partial [uncultured Mameliella sp.]|uniref:DUF6265 family protein n=1 Tax=uncultured Mameliella sp. TaxID=1447087 RepID=UPI00261DFFE5
MTDENQFSALVLEEDDDHKVTAGVETLDNDHLPPGDVTVAVEYSTLNYKDAMIIQGIEWAWARRSLVLAAPLAAQETRIGEDDFESPPATLADLDWLVGQWHGTGIGGAPATESWLPPTGPTMVGTFVQQRADGGIQFTEH